MLYFDQSLHYLVSPQPRVIQDLTNMGYILAIMGVVGITNTIVTLLVTTNKMDGRLFTSQSLILLYSDKYIL